MKTGIELIAIERQEQIEKHGRTIAKDVVENKEMQLSFGAALLCCPDPIEMGYIPNSEDGKPDNWSSKIWDKMMAKPYKERLVIAGALIAAEIDRLNTPTT